MSSNLVTIGILSYKRTDLLVETLSCINETNISIDLIIVNNNEDIDIENDILKTLNNNLINIKYIWDRKNHGVAKGRNRIIESLRTKYLIIFDDDVYIPDINKIITNTIAAFNTEVNLGALAFHIKDMRTKKENRYEIPHKNKKLDPDKDYYTYLFIGAGHALRKSALDKTGFFPDDFGLYGMEEIDLAFRMIKYNYRIKYISNNIIYHKKSPDGRHSSKTVHYLSFVNRCKIAKNYFPKKELATTLLVRGGYLLYKTKDVGLLMKGIKDISTYKGKNAKFDEENFKYIKEVEGFLYW